MKKIIVVIVICCFLLPIIVTGQNTQILQILKQAQSSNALRQKYIIVDASDTNQLSVTNITSVAVLTRECHEPVTQLDVSNLSPGLYVVSFRNGKGVVVRKFVKL